MASPNPYHIRSITMPSRSNPILSLVKEQVCPLSCSQPTNLSALESLYDNLDSLLSLLLTEDVLCRQSEGVNELLEDYLRLVDSCDKMRDVVARVRVEQRGVLFMLRRRDRSGLEARIGTYTRSRKQMTKELTKCLENLRHVGRTPVIAHNHSSAQDHEVMDVLKQARSITVSLFRSLMSKFVERRKKWCLISGFFKSRVWSVETDDMETSEWEKVAMALQQLQAASSKLEENHVHDVIRLLDSSDEQMGSIEEILGCFCSRLIRTRVTVLNVLTN
ncbi:uncharacterized protein LOC18424305 [Amborella trichopoda]|uniref:Uncharacterized protein n=1 Tax=Amborella trichopoda TaxID=13333 RepID=W1NLG7_AMBTC|nr:uncharacterized protein LOC18424305 [Amborella trichopoda]ERM96373.1 hypothetical protein AMTR_s00001p00232960 [Amborella trichopoda]|eukprot:XP_006828957.1 uncharacterized protein LOC18424305 [Amborella trichopoda]